MGEFIPTEAEITGKIVYRDKKIYLKVNKGVIYQVTNARPLYDGDIIIYQNFTNEGCGVYILHVESIYEYNQNIKAIAVFSPHKPEIDDFMVRGAFLLRYVGEIAGAYLDGDGKCRLTVHDIDGKKYKPYEG